jgi:putative transposase
MLRGEGLTFYQNKFRIESARLPRWDYSSPGYYFVTICANDHQCIFGDIADDKMILNGNGKIVSDCIDQIPGHFSRAKTDAWIVMPNHVHGIIQIVVLPNLYKNVAVGGGGSRRDVACRDVACNVSTTTTETVATPPEPAIPTNNDEINKKMAAISPKPQSLSSIIRSFKSAVTNRIHAIGSNGDVWQPRFHDHIIRNDRELFAIRQYIRNNPSNWTNDRNIIETNTPNTGKQPWVVYMK